MKDEWNDVQRNVTAYWLSTMISSTANKGILKELRYLKTIIDTEEGGKYILSLQHVEGTVINLENFK